MLNFLKTLPIVRHIRALRLRFLVERHRLQMRAIGFWSSGAYRDSDDDVIQAVWDGKQ